MNRVKALLGVALALLMLTTGSSAFAHASLLRLEPADGSVLPQAPAGFVLVFNEPVTPTSMRLIEPDGSGAPLRNVKVDGQIVTVPLPSLGRGTRALSWRVVSADGHPVGGAIVFSIGTVNADRIAVPSRTPSGLAGAIWFVRVLLYLGLFVGVGGVFSTPGLVWNGNAQAGGSSARRSRSGCSRSSFRQARKGPTCLARGWRKARTRIRG